MRASREGGLLQSDLDRMAKTAKRHGVPIEMQDGTGRIFRVYPSVDDLKPSESGDPEIAYGGSTLEEWRNRRKRR
jgi:hypothetical protein